jgi:hypothetical protein
MESFRQLPFSNAQRQAQPSPQPTCPKRAVNSPNIQFNLYFAKQPWHICAENEIQEFQTICSLELHHIPHFILFINGQAIYGYSVKLKEGLCTCIYSRSGSSTPQQTIMQTGKKGSGLYRGLGIFFFLLYTGLIINSVGPSHNIFPVQSKHDLVIIWSPSTLGRKRPLTIDFK